MFYKFRIPLALFAVVALASCNDGDIATPDGEELTIGSTSVNGASFSTVRGEVKTSLTLTNDQDWLLTGGLFVADGATLTIEAGTTIYADNGENTPLVSVRQGGEIQANGTANNPIVFTTINSLNSSASAGDWGGIIINGRAETNLGFFGESEGGSGFYGGELDQDNSGSLRYVRIEYAGKVFGEDNELNGLSLNAVGSGTTLEYIQAFNCADDGFEFFGGSANLKYAVSTNSGDDSFDWTFGWNGYGQFWVVDQSADGDNGIEADNNENDFGALRFSSPVVSNVSIVSAGGDIGVLLRNGTQGLLYNGVITGFVDGGLEVDADGDPQVTSHIANGSLAASFFNAFNTGAEFAIPAAATSFEGNVTDEVTLTNRLAGSAASSFDPATANAWFTSAPFRGAIADDANDWTLGWVKNSDGTIRE